MHLYVEIWPLGICKMVRRGELDCLLYLPIIQSVNRMIAAAEEDTCLCTKVIHLELEGSDLTPSMTIYHIFSFLLGPWIRVYSCEKGYCQYSEVKVLLRTATEMERRPIT